MSIIFRRNIVFDSPRPRSIAFMLSLPTRSVRTFAAALSLTATMNRARSRLVRWVTPAVRPAMIRLSSTRSLGSIVYCVVQSRFAVRSRVRLLILTIQLHEDRDFDGAGCWKNAITVMQKNPAIGQVENGDAHDTLKLVSDVADAGIELFPQQIAAGVGTSGFGFLLANSIRRKHEGNG